MKITVLYFASLREKMGCSEAREDVAPGITVGALWESLRARPALAGWAAPVGFAVNGQWSGSERRLADGDTVALLPPVSGRETGPASHVCGWYCSLNETATTEIHTYPYATSTAEGPEATNRQPFSSAERGSICRRVASPKAAHSDPSPTSTPPVEDRIALRAI